MPCLSTRVYLLYPLSYIFYGVSLAGVICRRRHGSNYSSMAVADVGHRPLLLP